MASSSSCSSSTSTFTHRTLLELITPSTQIEQAIFRVAGQTEEKLNGLLPTLVKLVVDYVKPSEQERRCVFGEEDWAKHFGIVPPPPPLPRGMQEIWQSPCPTNPKRKVCETSTLVYIPASLNGKPLTAETFFQEHLEFSGLERPHDAPYWMLMLNEVLANGKKFNQREKIIADLNEAAGFAKLNLPLYQLPTLIETTVCLVNGFRSQEEIRLCCKDVFDSKHFSEYHPNRHFIVQRYSVDKISYNRFFKNNPTFHSHLWQERYRSDKIAMLDYASSSDDTGYLCEGFVAVRKFLPLQSKPTPLKPTPPQSKPTPTTISSCIVS